MSYHKVGLIILSKAGTPACSDSSFAILLEKYIDWGDVMMDEKEKKYLEGTRIEDIRGKRFNNLTVIDLDWNRLELDRIKKRSGKIKSYNCHWICECDCGEYVSVRYERAKSCGCKTGISIGEKNSKPKTISFERWCIENSHQDYLDLWDYELNDTKPREIGRGSSKKYWFKCAEGVHDSELWQIGELSRRSMRTLSCRKCNSFGYYLEKNNLLGMWSGNNNFSPYEVTARSNKKIRLTCEYCHNEREIEPSSFLENGLSCVCGDHKSYPNKYIYDFLKQLTTRFETEKSFEWSNVSDDNNPMLNGKKIYDYYIPSLSCIIENHGEQHYENTGWMRDAKYEQENDKIKKRIALANGIKFYIELDCRKSDMEWIKNNILTSELTKILDFGESDIDWFKCSSFASSNMAKLACDLWCSERFNSTTELSEYLSISKKAILTYLKRGHELGWCVYNAKDEMRRIAFKNGKHNCKTVEVFKDALSLGVFSSARDLSLLSMDLFGVKFSTNMISVICNGKRKQCKGYTFKHI